MDATYIVTNDEALGDYRCILKVSKQLRYLRLTSLDYEFSVSISL